MEKKKVNPAEVFCKYLVSTVDSGLAPLRGLIAAKDGSNWLGFKKTVHRGLRRRFLKNNVFFII